MSFKYVTAKSFKNSYNISLINACIFINALINLNNITVYSKYFKPVRNIIFYFLPFFILIL
jgi:hypothetical protein